MSDTPIEAAPVADGDTEGDQPAVDQGKIRTAAALIRGGQAIVPIADSAGALFQEYWDVIGGDGLNDDELAVLGISADTLAATVTLLENFVHFANGEDVAKTTYRVTLNKIRRAAARL